MNLPNPKFGKWIRCIDQQPDLEVPVILSGFEKHRGMTHNVVIAKRIAANEFHAGNRGLVLIGDHWMPLPPAPSERREKSK